MNKEKTIKDICKIICATCAQFDGCAINCKAHRDTAEALYIVGYRKIDENCAVITKAELKEYERQAIKEFAKWIKDNITDIPFCNQKAYNVFCDMVNEKLKEYEK